MLGILLLRSKSVLCHLKKASGIFFADLGGDVLNFCPDSLFVRFLRLFVCFEAFFRTDEFCRCGLFAQEPSERSTDSEPHDEQTVFNEGCHGETFMTTVYDEYPL